MTTRQIRLLSDNIMVRLEPPKDRLVAEDGIEIHYPTGSHGHQSEINVWGEVLQVGPGKWAKKSNGIELGTRLPMEVKVGDRVMVVWYLAKVETQMGLQHYVGNDVIIIKPGDIICVDPC